ncbi:MAG: hypothetical protein V4724_19915 [Pseudomonadota bacterium]
MKTAILCCLLALTGSGTLAQAAEPARPALPRVVPDASGGAAATEAFRRLPLCSLAPDGKRLLVEPCRPAPSRNFTQRRAVPQTVLRMPPPPAPPAPSGYAATPVTPPTPLAPPPVQPLNNCIGGVCRGADGTPYQGGTGNVVLDPAGRLCSRNGAWVQCF